MASSFVSHISNRIFGSDPFEYRTMSEQEKNEIMQPVYARGDRFMHFFFLVHCLIAIGLAFFYDTWLVTAVVGGAALLMFIISVRLLPRHFITRCIAGLSLQLFVALHIYQMHGLAEMHFFFFTGFTMMLIYEDWASMWPGTVFIIAQHTIFAVYHNQGAPLYFFEDTYITILKLAFHFGIAIAQVLICGYWAYSLRRNTFQNYLRNQSLTNNNEELQVLITKQQEAERRLQESYNKAEEYRLLLQSILDTTPDWIFAKDRNFKVTLASQGFADSLHQDIHTIKGKTDEELGFPHELIYGVPEKGIRGFRVDDEAALSGKIIRNNYDPATTATGELKIFDTIKVPIRNAEGEIIGALGMARDVTEIRNKEEELHKARDEAQAANRAKSEFLANMSHEIRTPMNAILGFAEILMGRLSGSELRRYVEIIYSGGKSLLTIINDILDLSKIEAGKFELEYRPVNLSRLLDELRAFFQIRLEEKNLNFQVEIDPALPRSLLIDEIRIRQILVNLVGNAVKFTESGFVRVAVIVAESNHEHSDVRLVLEVEDSGIGIPDEQLQRIFEAFYQPGTQSIRKFGGTGLGLSITRRLVEMMGGSIDVRSTVGSGSVFRVILPHVHIGSVLPASGLPEKNREIVFTDTRVMVVDDNSINRELIKEYLAPYPFTIIEAENGEQAIERAKEFVPDLIIMDIKMPVMDGYTATRHIASDARTSSIPVIALSASAMPGEKDRSFETGCRGFLSKPVSRCELVEELMKFLPHTVVNLPAVNDNEHPVFPVEEHVYEQLTASENAPSCPEILIALETTYLEQWEELSVLLMPNEVERFADSLLTLCALHPGSALYKFAEALKHQAHDMLFSQLEKTLQTYPDIVRELRNHIEKEELLNAPEE